MDITNKINTHTHTHTHTHTRVAVVHEYLAGIQTERAKEKETTTNRKKTKNQQFTYLVEWDASFVVDLKAGYDYDKHEIQTTNGITWCPFQLVICIQ